MITEIAALMAGLAALAVALWLWLRNPPGGGGGTPVPPTEGMRVSYRSRA